VDSYHSLSIKRRSQIKYRKTIWVGRIKDIFVSEVAEISGLQQIIND
jgi:hypothetical protein